VNELRRRRRRQSRPSIRSWTRSPTTDAEWERIGASAAVLTEAGNLLMSGNRAVDDGDWNTYARELIDSANTVQRAVASKDPEQLLQAGGPLDETCDRCHSKYQR
jgi:hypothetical protein